MNLFRNHAISSNIRKQLTKKNSLQNVLRITWKHREWNTAGIETAFTAAWTNSDIDITKIQPAGKNVSSSNEVPIIGFLAEYDALPEIGHACGHNLLGTAVCAAACALKADYESSGEPIVIRVYGCPAEEIMSGKIIMDEQNVFDDLSIAVTWHPFDRNRVSNDIWQAQDIKNYTFHGVSAHASRSPESGRSALDAAELMNVGVNYLREHVTDDVRMHYAYMDNGIPANVVPDFAKTNYFIRSTKRSRTEDASKRVDACAKGAAMMTGTTVDIELVGSCMEMKVNRPLVEVYYEAMTHITGFCKRHFRKGRTYEQWKIFCRTLSAGGHASSTFHWNRCLPGQPYRSPHHHQRCYYVPRHRTSPLGSQRTSRHEYWA